MTITPFFWVVLLSYFGTQEHLLQSTEALGLSHEFSFTSCLTLGKLYLTFLSLVSSSMKWNELVKVTYCIGKFLGSNELVFVQAPSIMSGAYKCSINVNCERPPTEAVQCLLTCILNISVFFLHFCIRTRCKWLSSHLLLILCNHNCIV